MVENLFNWEEFWNKAQTIPEVKKDPESKYLPTIEVAKLIRKKLKESYPNVKFSVVSKCYSGGSSINVHWLNGPTEDAINKIVKKFQGARFDAMIDLKEYHGPTLYDGEWVTFGVDFVFATRKYSDDIFINAANSICKKWGIQQKFNSIEDICSSNIRMGEYYLREQVYQELHKKHF